MQLQLNSSTFNYTEETSKSILGKFIKAYVSALEFEQIQSTEKENHFEHEPMHKKTKITSDDEDSENDLKICETVEEEF